MVSEELQYAVIRIVGVIGEAAKRVSADARGLLASLDEVWNAASSRIPELQAVLEQFLAVGEGVRPTQLP